MASVKSTKEGEGIKLGGGRTCIDIERGLVVSSSKPSEGFGSFGLKTIGGWFVGSGLKTKHGQFDDLGLKTIGGEFDRFEPQNRGVADRWTRGGISKLPSRRSNVTMAAGPLDQ
jgi:hypothetical protein